MKALAFTVLSLSICLSLLLSPLTGDALSASAELPLSDPATPAAEPEYADAAEVTQATPWMFVENVGQFSEDARFHVHSGMGGGIWLADDALWITLVQQDGTASEPGALSDLAEPAPEFQLGVNLKLHFEGANPTPQIIPFDPLETSVNYLQGSDPAQQRTEVPIWGGVRYVDLYPGVDLELSSEEGHWDWTFKVHDEQADLSDVQLWVEGAEELEVVQEQLWLSTAVGKITLPLVEVVGVLPEQRPAVAEFDGGSFEVSAPFSLSDSEPLDGILEDNAADLQFATFVGGSGQDQGRAMALDGAGNVYVTGFTYISDFPTTPGAYDQVHNGAQDLIVFKLSADGSSLLYSTFVGGSDIDRGTAIAVDEFGNVFVTGLTLSADFPTTPGAYATSSHGGHEAIVFKLDADGDTLLYSTFVGGSDLDSARALALDGAGNVFVAGYTAGGGFPTTPGAYDTQFDGREDAFVFKLDANGASLLFSTFVGGGDYEYSYEMTVDEAGNPVVVGSTASADFPTTEGAYDTTHNGSHDAFLFKLGEDGSSLRYSTFFGGSDYDVALAVALDGMAKVAVAGYTTSVNFPTTAGAYDTSHNGGQDVFVLSLDTNSNLLHYSTLMGGSENDWCQGLGLNAAGNVVAAGSVYSSDFPTTSGAFDTSYNGSGNGAGDIVAFVLDSSGDSLLYSTFVGGSTGDHVLAMALDQAGNPVVVGATASWNAPVTAGAYDPSHNGDYDAYVFALALGNSAPNVSAEGQFITANEGQAATNTGTVSDPDNDSVTLSASVGAVINHGDGTWSWTFETSDGPDGSQTVTIYAADGNGGTDDVAFELAVNNVAPTIDSITAPIDPVGINDQPVSVGATFSDPGTADIHDVTWDWGDNSADTQCSVISPASHDHVYAEAGVYPVQVIVSDDDGGSDMELYEYVVIYDPEGGFVTGGGWIWSEPGWCQLDDLCTGAEGKASFGFVSKYKKGASVPTGNTEFNFQAGGLNFHSDTYQWLVVNQGGTNAQYKGTGTINGQLAPNGEAHKFMLWAKDDDPIYGDTFRIKIWYEDGGEILIYDNGFDQAIGSGSIVVHTK